MSRDQVSLLLSQGEKEKHKDKIQIADRPHSAAGLVLLVDRN